MSSSQPPNLRDEEDEGPAAKGVNLALLYSLIVIALVTAIGCALMIVLPFYQHRR